MGGLMSLAHKGRLSAPTITIGSNRSYVGVDDFRTTDGGATFKNVEPPGSPADKAGLVGGDIVTSFDGHAIRQADEVMDLLGNTPIGKTVEVVYLRDGISRTTKLTTISRDEYNRLDREYSRRPEGNGKFGFERGRMTRISRPETKTFGVQIDWLKRTDRRFFGIKRGDIITDFDNVPIARRTSSTCVRQHSLHYGEYYGFSGKDWVPVKIGRPATAYRILFSISPHLPDLFGICLKSFKQRRAVRLRVLFPRLHDPRATRGQNRARRSRHL